MMDEPYLPTSDDHCEHLSATGIDDTPLANPNKVWRCDGCGMLYRDVIEGGVAHIVPLVEDAAIELGGGVIAEVYANVNGTQTEWWTFHCGKEYVGIRRRGDDFTAIMPAAAFWGAILKLEQGGGRPHG
jgi:hypothetical protein